MICSRRRFVLLASLASLSMGAAGLLSLAGAEEREVLLYELRHRAAEDLIPVAQDLMGERGTATHHPGTNSILLVGPPEEVAQTLRILLMQDRALRSVVVHYRTLGLAELQAAGIEIRWSLAAGGIRLGNIEPPPEGDAFAAKLHADWRREKLESGSSIRVLEGSTGKIEVGTAVPYQTGGRLSGSTSFVTAGTGFVSSARIMGDGRVRLAIDLFESSIRPDGSLPSASAETLLELEPGEIKVLAGIGEAKHARSSSLARSVRNSDSYDCD